MAAALAAPPGRRGRRGGRQPEGCTHRRTSNLRVSSPLSWGNDALDEAGARTAQRVAFIGSALRRVPDRRGPGTLLVLHRTPATSSRRSALVVGGPAGRRDFDDAGVVEGTLRRLEVGIRPHRGELGRADRVGPSRSLDVDRVAHGGQLAIRSGLRSADQRRRRSSPAPAGRVDPALDDLDAV